MPRDKTLAALQKVYEGIGFDVCSDGQLEEGYEKIALYADIFGSATHAARQLSSGKWTSKLGKSVDIEHAAPEDVEGRRYGAALIFMKRKKT